MGKAPRSITWENIVATVKQNFGKRLPLLETVIPATVWLAEISMADKSIFQHEPRGRAADVYRSLTKEVLEIGEKRRNMYCIPTQELNAPKKKNLTFLENML